MADLREENARLRRAVYDMQNSLARLTEINKLNYENSVFITEGIQKIIQTSEKKWGVFLDPECIDTIIQQLTRTLHTVLTIILA